MIEVSPNGEVPREIVILDLLFENGMEGELFANNRMLGLNPEKDWRPAGTIMAFDNRFDRTARGDHPGGSRVVATDPRTGAVKTRYGDGPNHVMYTATQGDQQLLANGNLLMAEAEAGRIIEVTPDGEVVWEYINRYSDTEVLRVSDATNYPRSFFSNLDRTCN